MGAYSEFSSDLEVGVIFSFSPAPEVGLYLLTQARSLDFRKGEEGLVVLSFSHFRSYFMPSHKGALTGFSKGEGVGFSLFPPTPGVFTFLHGRGHLNIP